jgi:hypothetical protein
MAPEVRTRRLLVAALSAALSLAAGCGSGDGSPPPSPPPAQRAEGETTRSAGAETAATDIGDLAESDRKAVTATTRAYIAALDSRDGAAVCALFEPGAVDAVKLPAGGSGCAEAVGASIGHVHGGGTPQWKRTRLDELTAVSVGEHRARVTATVVHIFSDRNYPSIEEDVIYLDRDVEDGRQGWEIAKPSGSFYRAVGYPEPPIEAFTAP